MDSLCPLLFQSDKGSDTENEIKAGLEGSDVAAKAEAMKRAVTLLVNGDTLPELLATVVSHVFPSEDRTIQKLLLLYLEAIHARDADGHLLLLWAVPIRQRLRDNLRHPNEYVRGVTLRFLCRFSKPELLWTLVPSVLENLGHRHHYVRRHALSAASAIYRLPRVRDLFVPDAARLVTSTFASDRDASARRNAFLALCLCAEERASAYLFSMAERVTEWPGLLQMAAVGLIRKVCRSSNRADKGRCIKIITSLLSSPSTGAAVAYECAGALVSLSSAATNARCAADAYCRLLLSEGDDGVRLILLDRLNELCRSHRFVIVARPAH